MQRAWLSLFAAVCGVLVLIGCGRVNLEDLTPSSYKTQTSATETVRAGLPTPTPNASPGAGGGGGAVGDAAAGGQLYNFWCTGCHDSGRNGAPPIKGKTYDLPGVTPLLRGTSGQQHPSYKPFELTDKNVQDILAFLAAS
jgi:mono/diheme cytochrome c family protein